MKINIENDNSVTFYSTRHNIKMNKLSTNYINILVEMGKLKNDDTLTMEEKRIKLKQILE